nr:hypothetical protein Iba_chr06cCG14540 [Ipomoea batatas]
MGERKVLTPGKVPVTVFKTLTWAHPGASAGTGLGRLTVMSSLHPGARCPVTGLRTLTVRCAAPRTIVPGYGSDLNGERKVPTPGKARCPVYRSSTLIVVKSKGAHPWQQGARLPVSRPLNVRARRTRSADRALLRKERPDIRQGRLVHRYLQGGLDIVLYRPSPAVKGPSAELVHQRLPRPDEFRRSLLRNGFIQVSWPLDRCAGGRRISEEFLLPQIRRSKSVSRSWAMRSPTKADDHRSSSPEAGCGADSGCRAAGSFIPRASSARSTSDLTSFSFPRFGRSGPRPDSPLSWRDACAKGCPRRDRASALGSVVFALGLLGRANFLRRGCVDGRDRELLLVPEQKHTRRYNSHSRVTDHQVFEPQRETS